MRLLSLPRGNVGSVRFARYVAVALAVVLIGLGAAFFLTGVQIVHVSPDHRHTTTFP
jgi:hypothetical protein